MDAPKQRASEICEACRRLPLGERQAWLDEQKLDPRMRQEVDEMLDATRIEIAQTTAWQRTSEAVEALGAAPAGPMPDVTIVRPAASLSMAGEKAPADRLRKADAAGKGAAPAESGVDPMLGKTFAAVEIEKILGSGGMGRVYLGKDTLSKETGPAARVALKVLLRTQRDESVRRRFDREARLLEKLRHPAIAAVLRTGVESDGDIDTPYIVMEYVAGVQNISDYVFRERLGMRETVELFLQACDGVGFAHREGYIHRDLKPPNILVDRHGRVKVIDFGVARAASHDVNAATVRTQTGQIVGTMQYMSPEQFVADPRQIDKRSDVYALGAVLFELLTGVQPHDIRGLPVHEAARTVCERDAPDIRTCNPRIDDLLASIVQHSLAREKAQRPDDANDLSGRLRNWLGTAVRHPEQVRPPAHPDREFAAQTGVEVAPTAIVMGVGGGGGGVKIVAPAVGAARYPRGGGARSKSGTGKGGWALIIFVTALVVAALLVAFDVVPLKRVMDTARGLYASATGGKTATAEGGDATSAPASEVGSGRRNDAGTTHAGATKSAGRATSSVHELRVVSAPAGAQIIVEGEPRGITPAVVLLPDAPQVMVNLDLTLEGYKPARVIWKTGTPPIISANMEPLGEVDQLPRIFTLAIGPLPPGATLNLVLPDHRALGAGTWCVEVPFRREGEGWSPGMIELQATGKSGAPLSIELGAARGTGTLRHEVSAADAATPLHIRVR